VIADRTSCRQHVPGLDRTHDLPVIVDDLLQTSDLRQVQVPNAVYVPTASTDQLMKLGDASSLENPPMELAVGEIERGKIAFCREITLLPDEGDQLQHDAPVRAEAKRLGSLLLQRPAQELGLAGMGDIDQADPRRALGDDLDQSFLAKAQKRITDRCRTEAELRLQLKPVDDGPRLEAKADDLLPQPIVDQGCRTWRGFGAVLCGSGTSLGWHGWRVLHRAGQAATGHGKLPDRIAPNRLACASTILGSCIKIHI
jgi:hypothetical protein